MTKQKTSPPARLACDQPSNPADLVAIAEDAIVSRVLARAEGGSVTLFAFDGGQALSEHTAPFDAVVEVVTGTLMVTIGGRDLDIRSGETVRVPAGVPHAVRAPEPCRMLLTMLRDAEKGS